MDNREIEQDALFYLEMLISWVYCQAPHRLKGSNVPVNNISTNFTKYQNDAEGPVPNIMQHINELYNKTNEMYFSWILFW